MNRIILNFSSPLILVQSSKNVDSIFEELEFWEFLVPFSVQKNKIYTRDSQNQVHCLENFQLRFISLEKLKKLRALSFEFPKNAASDIFLDYDREATKEYCTSVTENVFASLNFQLFSLFNFNDHETFNHPHGSMFIISTQDSEDEWASLQDSLFDDEVFTSEFIQENIPKCYILVSNSLTETRSEE